MTKIEKLFLAVTLFVIPAALLAQEFNPALLTKPATDSWPTYSGDYSGRRYSTLTQINQSNIKSLALAWVGHAPAGPATPAATGPRGGGSTAPTIVGGATDDDIQLAGNWGNGGGRVAGSILQVNGILYFAAPDNAWAMDARDGTLQWHYYWKTKGGTHIGNRGVGMAGNSIYFETPDDYLICLDAKTGKERWHKEIADFDEQYFSTMAPILIGNHLLIGTGDDADAPGFLKSVDPETGDLQWTWWSEPLKMGDAGSETWPNLDAMRHGGGNVWIPGSYDPETHLYYFGTGNPTPTYAGASRKGDNLYACSIVAVNVDTGKLVWYFQPSPHDTHDWDAAQTPVLVDADFQGKPRKLLLDASRNGYFFVLDRVTGEHLVTTAFSTAANWTTGINQTGEPIPNVGKEAQPGGALVSPWSTGATNWPPPSFDPETGLMYVPVNESYSEFYLTDSNPLAGSAQEQPIGSLGGGIAAIDYRTGKVAWRHPYPGGFAGDGTGLLSTAGKLLFAGDSGGNLVAYDPANGKPLWHSHIGSVLNAPETYMLDGRQYVLVVSGDALYAFALN